MLLFYHFNLFIFYAFIHENSIYIISIASVKVTKRNKTPFAIFWYTDRSKWQTSDKVHRNFHFSISIIFYILSTNKVRDKSNFTHHQTSYSYHFFIYPSHLIFFLTHLRHESESCIPFLACSLNSVLKQWHDSDFRISSHMHFLAQSHKVISQLISCFLW